MARIASQADYEQEIAAALEADLRQATGRDLRLGAGVMRLRGGFDTETYAFRIDGAPESLSGDLVVRFFRGRESHRVRSEAAIQSQLAERYPAPRVLIDTAGRTIMGIPYLVMRRMPGRSLLDTLLADPSAAAPAGALLGAAQAKLHGLPARETACALAGFDLSAWAPHRLLVDIRQLAQATGDPMLTGLGRWLDERQPAAAVSPCLCHGDFHPGNVLVADMELTGVIDWTNFALGHPEFDVAITRLILSIGLVEPNPDDVGPELLRHYDAAYGAARHLDERLVRYYAVLRAGRALARIVARGYGTEIRGTPPDGYAWSQRRPYAAIRALIREATGLEAASSGLR